jgi:hypothetical protein
MIPNPPLLTFAEEELAQEMPPNEGTRRSRQIALLVLGTLFLLALGVWGNWPWLTIEHARLEPLQAWLLWAADGTAVAWAVWFGLWYGLLGKPVPTGPVAGRTFWWVLLTLLVGLVVDAAVTAVSAYREETGRERAVAAPRAELTGGRTSLNGDLAYVECRFQDQNGNWHESLMSLSLNRHPPALGAAIRAGQFPIPVQIKYDPDWPPRCWPEPAPDGEHQPLYLLSLCVLLFQGLLTFGAAACYWKGEWPAGSVPIYQFVPVWGVMLPLCCGALGKFLSGEL